MKEDTAQRLLAINRAFYRRHAVDFARTRRQAWPGWERLRPWLRGRARLLDVGCGNGRFGRFWAQLHPNEPLGYHAIDTSLPLLWEAAHTMGAFPRVHTRLEWRDIFRDPPRHGHYPLIVMLGVLHHIPGHSHRAALLRALAARLSAGGILIITFWRFGADPRLRGRARPWPPALADRVEANDFLLPWGEGQEGAVRYCHHFDENEERELVATSGLRLAQSFAADGASGALNAYRILRQDNNNT
ncbi:MAG: class I SAM-dependent methyltransferase [Anaerolineaceae bacterium]|nr:class I SAM-dependent methyltransferase [Anaerolineaceae bacterium]